MEPSTSTPSLPTNQPSANTEPGLEHIPLTSAESTQPGSMNPMPPASAPNEESGSEYAQSAPAASTHSGLDNTPSANKQSDLVQTLATVANLAEQLSSANKPLAVAQVIQEKLAESSAGDPQVMPSEGEEPREQPQEPGVPSSLKEEDKVPRIVEKHESGHSKAKFLCCGKKKADKVNKAFMKAEVATEVVKETANKTGEVAEKTKEAVESVKETLESVKETGATLKNMYMDHEDTIKKGAKLLKKAQQKGKKIK